MLAVVIPGPQPFAMKRTGWAAPPEKSAPVMVPLAISVVVTALAWMALALTESVARSIA